MVHYKCDICGSLTVMNPPTEQVMEDKQIPVDVPKYDEKGTFLGIEKQTQVIKIPVMIEVKRQNPVHGGMETISVPKLNDLAPRAYLVNLSIGWSDILKKDFCKDCLDREVMPILKPLWDKLSSIEDQSQDE